MNKLKPPIPFQPSELVLYPKHPIWSDLNISSKYIFQLRHYLEYGNKPDIELLNILYGEWDCTLLKTPDEFISICSIIKKIFPPQAYGSKTKVKKWVKKAGKYNWLVDSPYTLPDIEAFVYIWFDGINRKFYIGSHKGNPYTTPYAHSSKVMRNFSLTKVPYYFKRKILAIGTEDAIAWAETYFLLDRQVPLNEKYYNKIITDPDSRLDQRKGIKKNKHKFMGKKRKMSREQIKIIKAEFETTALTKVELAKKWDISRATLYRIAAMELNDLPDETEFLPHEAGGRVSYYDDMKGMIQEMVDKGMTKNKISKTLGIGESTVYKYIKQMNQKEN
jgi:hypothetical protein